MQVPEALADDLYHKHGEFVLSNKQRAALVNTEHVNVAAHPAPVVLHPVKYVLQAASDVAVVLSVHNIGLQTEFYQIQTF